MKVFNPKPRLVNVYTGSGKFIRILPNQEADIGDVDVSKLLKSGRLEEVGGKRRASDENETDTSKQLAGNPNPAWGGNAKPKKPE